MGKVKVQIMDIPLEALGDLDDMFFRQVQMNGARVMKKFAAQYEDTKQRIYRNVTAKGMFVSVGIDGISGEEITIEDGSVISNQLLADLFASSEELVACAITLCGYDELEEKETGNIETIFLDGWGTAIAETAHVWLKDVLKEQLRQEGLYSTCSWSPGQHNVDIGLQKDLFRILKPEEIGIVLKPSLMMNPKKSISSFIGIGTTPDVERVRACDFCEYRETCPSAYV